MDITDFVIGYEDFKAQYKNAATDIDSATIFWNKYNVDPIGKIRNGQSLQLRDKLFQLLRTCKQIDADTFTKIHKGHPYYFIGITSYLLHDYPTALYYFDASVTEDLEVMIHKPEETPPSILFITLDADNRRQAAWNLTNDAKTRIEREIEYYNKKFNKVLSVNALREKFIQPALMDKINPGLRTLITALITFSLEWDWRNEHFDLGVKDGTSEPFFLHLFKGCLLFESLLRASSIKPEGELKGILDNPEIRTKLGTNPVNGKGPGLRFDLKDLYTNLKSTTNIQDELQIVYVARNTLGHNLGWDDHINQDQYRQLYLTISSFCLHTINQLWIA